MSSSRREPGRGTVLPQQMPKSGEVYFEFTAIGRNVKVAAIDAATGAEVSVIGPATASQADLQRLALQKLKAKLRRAADMQAGST